MTRHSLQIVFRSKVFYNKDEDKDGATAATYSNFTSLVLLRVPLNVRPSYETGKIFFIMDSTDRPNAATSWISLFSSAFSTAVGLERIAQLATIRGPASGNLNGRPACRCINIRKFDNGKLYFVTDLRSAKVDDVTHSPYVELCWYTSRHRVQFRISGEHRILTSCKQSQAMWDNLTERERIWWAWPYPGKQWSGDDAFNVTAPKQPPQNFCVFEINPNRVEVTDDTSLPFHREVHNLMKSGDGDNPQWTVQRLNP